MATLNVNIGAMHLKNPIMTASGTFGYGLEYADFVPLDGLGGIIVKGTTLAAREGNDYPRMAETPSGMLNCVGLQNKGVDYFCANIYPQIKDFDTNMIVNVSGSSPDDYAECAARIDELDRIPACATGRDGFRCNVCRSSPSGQSSAPSVSQDTYRQAVSERNGYHRDSSCL